MNSARIELEEFKISPDDFISSKSPRDKGSKRPKLMAGKEIKVMKMDNNTLEIDFIGFHASLTNAYRRIILAEVPTMAIEKVYMYNNTSIVQDEVLAHRLGLIPLNVDPRLFEVRSKDSTDWTPQECVKYKLKVKCTKASGVDPKSSSDLDTLYKNRKVLSSSLKWEPLGNQADLFPQGLKPLHDDILIAKMNPGHEINLECYAVKSIGSDHAKFQPGLAWYRLLPEIEILDDIKGVDIELLKKCFSPGVIATSQNEQGEEVAVVKDARYDSCSRNVFNYEKLKDKVKLTRKSDHFIFSVESNSYLKSHEILEEAISVMISKCDLLLTEINRYYEADE